MRRIKWPLLSLLLFLLVTLQASASVCNLRCASMTAMSAVTAPASGAAMRCCLAMASTATGNDVAVVADVPGLCGESHLCRGGGLLFVNLTLANSTLAIREFQQKKPGSQWSGFILIAGQPEGAADLLLSLKQDAPVLRPPLCAPVLANLRV